MAGLVTSSSPVSLKTSHVGQRCTLNLSRDQTFFRRCGVVASVVPARISSQSSRHCWRSPLPHASALIQRDFGCVLGAQQTKQLPYVAKVDLVW
ncbi:hypothetical protein TNCV_4132521 [Trichonephila clavipes]|nr:hypothetical protein TNCV_4132521 [Trichonephila clavipes]